MGFGLLLGDGERWQKARKMATPAFHFSKLEEYMQTIDFNARVCLNETSPILPPASLGSCRHT